MSQDLPPASEDKQVLDVIDRYRDAHELDENLAIILVKDLDRDYLELPLVELEDLLDRTVAERGAQRPSTHNWHELPAHRCIVWLLSMLTKSICLENWAFGGADGYRFANDYLNLFPGKEPAA